VSVVIAVGSLFAQGPRPVPVAPDWTGWLCLLMGLGLSALMLLYSAFWLWMFIDCILREPDRFFWIWLFVVAPFPGAIVYAIVRFFPQRDFTAPSWLRGWTRGRELARLETAAQQIGNAHQFIQWGDALREVGRWSQADAAYRRAIEKDPKSLPALWGSAQVAVKLKRPDDVVTFCRRILDVDPQYKFGDVSLAYGRALLDRQEFAAARAHLEQHCRRWRHPEAVYLLASRCRDDGDPAAAREHLLSMLRDLNASPVAIARKFGRWKSLSRRMLRSLPE
jgi:tetratricopeptide (TPR) repeat protein